MAHANSVEPDQTAPEGAVWSGSTLFAIPLGILGNNCIKKKWVKKVWNKVFEILGHLTGEKCLALWTLKKQVWMHSDSRQDFFITTYTISK